MYSGETDSAWSRKGATLSDKSARNEFGLTQDEIIEAIKDGKLRYRKNNVYGNPYFRLLRSEVETFVAKKYGNNYVAKQKIRKELAQVTRELKALKAQTVSLEQKRAELQESLDESG